MKKVLFLMVLFSGLVCVEGREFRANSLEAEKLFMDTDVVRISIEKEETPREKLPDGCGTVSTVWFFVTIENTSSVKFMDVEINPVTYTEEISGSSKLINGPETSHPRSFLKLLRENSKERVKAVGLGSFERPSRDWSRRPLGIIARVSLRLSDGRMIARDVRYPDSLPRDTFVWREFENVANDQSAIEHFLDGKRVSVSANEMVSEWVSDPGGTVETMDRVSRITQYKVQLNAQSAEDFSGMRMECRIYREQQKDGENYVSADFITKPVPAIHTFPNMPSNGASQVEVEIDNLISYRSATSKYYNDVVGARIRIYLPSPEGKDVMREIVVPEYLSYPWINFKEDRVKNLNNSAEKLLRDLTEEEKTAYLRLRQDVRNAYSQCMEYSRKGNQKETVKWAMKTRELIAKLPPNDRLASKLLKILDRVSGVR